MDRLDERLVALAVGELPEPVPEFGDAKSLASADREQVELRAVEDRCEARADEPDCGRVVRRCQMIDLVDREEDAWYSLERLVDQFLLGQAQGLVGGQDEQRGVDLGQKPAGGLGVVAVDRADARSVDDLQAGGKQVTGSLDDGQLHAETVRRVTGFRGELCQPVDGVLFLAAVLEANQQPLPWPVPEDRDRRGEGHDRGRQQHLAEQRVRERALASLELAEEDEVEAPLLETLPGFLEVIAGARPEHRLRERQELVDRRERLLPGARHRFGLCESLHASTVLSGRSHQPCRRFRRPSSPLRF